MTTWIGTPRENHDRGLTGTLRVWAAVAVRPRQLSCDGVASGDQALSLVFVIAAALVYQGLESAFELATIPTIEGGPPVLALVTLFVVAPLVAPALLHLTAATQTALLIPLLSRRAGVSEAVQVITYAAAPCASASLLIPDARALCAVYGAMLPVIGISEVRQTTIPKAASAAAAPTGVVFGYAFGNFRTLSELAAALTLI